MILTVTMNPSVDTRYQLDELIIDDVNRVTPEKTAGGKGLNVAGVRGQLGDDVVATGLLGGHMGAYMAELMDANGINNDFVPIKGETRICLNILHAGNQTELLESSHGELCDHGVVAFGKGDIAVDGVPCYNHSGGMGRGVAGHTLHPHGNVDKPFYILVLGIKL